MPRRASRTHRPDPDPESLAVDRAAKAAGWAGCAVVFIVGFVTLAVIHRLFDTASPEVPPVLAVAFGVGIVVFFVARPFVRIAYRRRAGREAREHYERTRDKWKLTCPRCGRLADPVPGTPDRYACQHCMHRFAGATHPFANVSAAP